MAQNETAISPPIATALHAEIARLRDLLEENGIDPDPAPPELPQFGPPTEWQDQMSKMMIKATAGLVRSVLLHDIAFAAGEQWAPGSKIGSTLPIRRPVSYNVVKR